MERERKKYRVRQIISTLLVVLFVLYYADIALFQHTHIINGVTVVHSHFHGSNHEKTPTGGHTTTEITFFADNSLFQTFGDVLTSIDIRLFLVFCGIVLVSGHNQFSKGFHDFFFLRAPPAEGTFLLSR
ncbi:MAG: hypothetical protein FWF53_10385 [Candidatus Azobacteroides sp.]|nr:hypothetical protein [Candidatus Azobacteroides sp.]